jgi:hypothetical protein
MEKERWILLVNIILPKKSIIYQEAKPLNIYKFVEAKFSGS